MFKCLYVHSRFQKDTQKYILSALGSGNEEKGRKRFSFWGFSVLSYFAFSTPLSILKFL